MFAQQEQDQMLAPIALYPDSLPPRILKVSTSQRTLRRNCREVRSVERPVQRLTLIFSVWIAV